MSTVGSVTQEIQKLLNLNISGDNHIYLGATNIAHMQSSHPTDYAKYKEEIPGILAAPDYVGINPSDNSIEYVKEFLVNKEFVKVALRISSGNKYYVRSIYVLNSNRVHNYIAKGTLKKT
jgi:hypothetical protein